MLRAWGGNASGSGIANIDNTGEVHPDTYWWQHSVGNVRHMPFRTLWLDQPDALLSRLREHPRAVGGRCAQCGWLPICNHGYLHNSDMRPSVTTMRSEPLLILVTFALFESDPP